MMWLLKHKQIILEIHWLLTLLSLLALPLTIVYPPLQTYWLPLGLLTGQLAVVFLFFTLLPGILKRFRVTGTLKNWQLILMAYRRRLGITMFLFALFHYLWQTLFPAIKFSSFSLPQSLANWAGLIALALLIPLFLTSNDTSVKLLKKSWSLLHKLVYPIALLVLLHLITKPTFDFAKALAFITCILLVVSLLSSPRDVK